MVETKAKARRQRKVPQGKGVRKNRKRPIRMVETKAKARRPRKVPKERVYEKLMEKREWQRPRRRLGIRERFSMERV